MYNVYVVISVCKNKENMSFIGQWTCCLLNQS